MLASQGQERLSTQRGPGGPQSVRTCCLGKGTGPKRTGRSESSKGNCCQWGRCVRPPHPPASSHKANIAHLKPARPKGHISLKVLIPLTCLSIYLCISHKIKGEQQQQQKIPTTWSGQGGRLTWSARRASAVACAALHAEPCCLFPGPGTAVPGLHCSAFPGQKGFILAGISLAPSSLVSV